MITLTLVRPGSLADVALDDAAMAMDPTTVHWIDLDSPNEQELRRAAELAGLPPAVSAQLRHQDPQSPRCATTEGFVLLDLNAYRHRGLVTADDFPWVRVILGRDIVLTVHQGPFAALAATRQRLSERTGAARVRPMAVALQLCESMTEGFIDASQRLEEEAGALEDLVLTRVGSGLPKRLMVIHRTGIKLRRLITLHESALERLGRLNGHELDAAEQVMLSDVLQQLSHADTLSDSVILVNESALNVHLTVRNNHMNDVMKVLAVVGTVFLPLTFLTGLYGTNFSVLPGARTPGGFWILLGISTAVIGGMSLYFYRLGWFRKDE